MSCASFWNSRPAADGSGPSATPFWPSGGTDTTRGCGRWWTLGPAGMAAMVLGFIFWWPLGLGMLALNIFKRRGGVMPFADLKDRNPFARATGNVAFDDWRRAEIERIDQERAKLAAAEREFATFVAEVRRAKDREEFDRFMNARNSGPAADAKAADSKA